MLKIINKKYIAGAALAAIVLVGIFLRTYNFHDWLRFNSDQARDAALISDAVDEKASLPLLGPKAGGTDFRLGPAFYYFQYASAELFGNYPDKMAYPDLLFSILSIPLLYLLLKKYFPLRTSLILSAIFSVSFYAVKYGRFAWNPNSIPFWTMLFILALLKIMENKDTRSFWPILVGVTVGIGVQLHTSLLIVLPLILICLIIVKKIDAKSQAAVILLVALFFNVPQIISEIKTNGSNTKAFMSGILAKNSRNKDMLSNVSTDIVCVSQGNLQIFSSSALSSDNCGWQKKISPSELANFVFSILFTLSGIFFLVKYFRREREEQKKNFLLLMMLYFFTSFLVFIPMANELSMRFFLMIVFVPFIFLGFWIEALLSKKIWGKASVAIIFTVLLCLNGADIREAALASEQKVKGNDISGIVTLEELEDMMNFITEESKPSQIAALDGKNQLLFDYLRPVQYLARFYGMKIVSKDEAEGIPNDFEFRVINKRSVEANDPELLGYKILRRVVILKVKI